MLFILTPKEKRTNSYIYKLAIIGLVFNFIIWVIYKNDVQYFSSVPSIGSVLIGGYALILLINLIIHGFFEKKYSVFSAAIVLWPSAFLMLPWITLNAGGVFPAAHRYVIVSSAGIALIWALLALLKINKRVLIYLFITILFSLPIGSIYAEEVEQLELPKTTVNPGSSYYPFKRLFEKGKERLVFSEEQKISFYTSLLKTRLSELDFVVSNKILSEVQGSSERFAYYAGVLTEELVKQNKVNDKEKVIKEFEQYSKFLPNLRDKYPVNSSFWMLVQHDINSLNILSERLKLIP